MNCLDGTGAAAHGEDLTATPAAPRTDRAGRRVGPAPVGSDATLSYKVMFGADVALAMQDGAASPGGAGDGVFAATIPGQAAGRLVRYRIDAVSLGVPFSYPATGDSVRYRGVVVLQPRGHHQPARHRVVHGGRRLQRHAGQPPLRRRHRARRSSPTTAQVYDGARMSVRGNSTRTKPKVNWKVELPKGHDFDLGGELPYPLDEFAIQRTPDPFADVAWDTVEAGRRPAPGDPPVRTQRNGSSGASAGSWSPRTATGGTPRA